MKLYTSLLLVFCTLSYAAGAQSPQTITIHAGEPFDNLIKQVFNYPAFINGAATYSDGNSYYYKFNYNLLAGEVQFINEKGDTASVPNENSLREIIIGNDTFFFKKQYFQVITANSKATLAVSKRITEGDHQKIGAYGIASSSSSITSFKTIFSGNRVNDLTIKEDIIFSKTVRYFIVDASGQALPYTKRNLLKLFSSSANKIESYLNSNPKDFHNEQDLIELTNFLKSLS